MLGLGAIQLFHNSKLTQIVVLTLLDGSHS
jgi:hypothetical protein